MTVGRNEPCPCGSGRKYKHCCLREVESRREVVPDLGVREALEWLSRRFRDQIEENLEMDFFVDHSLSEINGAIAALGDGMAEMLSINIGDFLLCDAVFERGEEEGRGIDWVLERGGPRLTPSQRDFLEALADAPLRLYEVVGVRPGEGLELRDAVDSERSPPFITERTASRSLRVGSMLGTRVVRQADRISLGGALFPLDRMTALDVIDSVRQMLDPDELDEPGDDDGALGNGEPDGALPLGQEAADGSVPIAPELAEILEELDRDLTPEEEADAGAVYAEMEDDCLADALRAAWLGSLLPRPLPDLVDRATGAPLLLVEDDYDVVDPAALAAALAAQGDVIGDAKEGWTRVDDSGEPGAPGRILSTVNACDTPRRVTLFHSTASAAELGVEWFACVAGSHVTHRTRRVTDPRDSLSNPAGVVPLPSAGRSRDPGIAPDVQQQVYEQFIRKTYADWCDEPVPVLGGKTPRACLSAPADRERVRFLLRSYEQAEEEAASAAGRAPVSFDFLWQSLGLAREEGR